MRNQTWGTGLVLAALLFAWGLSAWASESEVYFATDRNGETRVTRVQEGEQIWIVVIDPDQSVDCDLRNKVWTDIKVFDVKTGAHIVWKSYLDEAGVDTDGDGTGDTLFGEAEYVPHKGRWPGPTAGYLGEDYLEETGADTGVFVSSRAFQIGTRVAFSNDGRDHAHIVGPYEGNAGGWVEPTDFQWGNYLYAGGEENPEIGDTRVWVRADQRFTTATIPGWHVPPRNAYVPAGVPPPADDRDYMLGRFENMDTLVGLYVDPFNRSDVALTMAKIADTQATIEWDQEVYRHGRKAAVIRITDPDENLSCSEVEMVPVFVIVNPGSWNLMPTAAGQQPSPNDFCLLKRYGGVIDEDGNMPEDAAPIMWYSIYDSGLTPVDVDLAAVGSSQPNAPGAYYMQYPTRDEDNVTWFDTASTTGVTRVMFYATETAPDSGVFELRLNNLRRDLGFNSFNVGDTLVAYYLDPNDQDDFALATAHIGRKHNATLQFTDASGHEKSEFWIGRDPVYMKVTDSQANVNDCCPDRVAVVVCDPHEVDDIEWLVLDETASNSGIFFSHAGMRLGPVWDALGIGEPGALGGYALRLDNWTLDVFNEDVIYGRYNSVVYEDAELALLGDSDIATAFPPQVREVRAAGDVAFATFRVGDTQVFDGETTTMHFLDRQGNRVTEYMNSDCVFIEVVDPDQNEDPHRRERIAAFWDGNGVQGQNVPFGPMDFEANHAACGFDEEATHIVNDLLGDTHIFGAGGTWAKTYILNPRNGRWAPVDLLETENGSGQFISVACVDLASRYECTPSLGVLPGDTLLAVYNDPTNHSDVAWISIKVGMGGASLPPSQTSFVDVDGSPVTVYVEGDPIYVQVVDASIADAGMLEGAVTLLGQTYDLFPVEKVAPGTFRTHRLDLGLAAGDTVTATYVDPSDPRDTSSATARIVASTLRVERFYAGPTPFADTVRFAYEGDGLAERFTVSVYDLVGRRVWSSEAQNVLSIPWDGRRQDGRLLANGAYLYVIAASNGDDLFTGRGTVFISR